MRRVALLSIVAATASACVDVRNFADRWEGPILAEPSVRQGFAEDTRVAPLVLDDVTLQGLTAELTTSDGTFGQTPLTRITKAAGDALASVSFDGDPLRTYLLFARPATDPEAGSALIVVSLFGDDHVELRVLRDNALFGVFDLQRAKRP
jgi:hypothetical protein